jgi:Domain of unknown function (DUF1905)
VDTAFTVTAPIWLWSGGGVASWYFLTIDGQTSAEIRYETLGRTGGFGSVKVVARIGETEFRTSLFPSKEQGGFILPVKAAVRKAEGIGAGDVVTVELRV